MVGSIEGMKKRVECGVGGFRDFREGERLLCRNKIKSDSNMVERRRNSLCTEKVERRRNSFGSEKIKRRNSFCTENLEKRRNCVCTDSVKRKESLCVNMIERRCSLQTNNIDKQFCLYVKRRNSFCCVVEYCPKGIYFLYWNKWCKQNTTDMYIQYVCTVK